MRNLFMRIIKSSKRKEWNENHIIYWKKSLELSDAGFTIFQNELLDKLEQVLIHQAISYDTEITKHLDDENRIVKMVVLTLDKNSKFWIYHDMADLTIEKKHRIFEEWGYLKPEDLINEYLKSTKELLKIRSLRN